LGAITGCVQSQQTRLLFDHLTGASEQRRRHVEAEGFRGLEVDDEIEFGRGLHRQICRLLALERTIRRQQLRGVNRFVLI